MILDGDLQGEWAPGAKRESRVVFIGRNLDQAKLREGFMATLA
jgi:G3E family GTPase